MQNILLRPEDTVTDEYLETVQGCTQVDESVFIQPAATFKKIQFSDSLEVAGSLYCEKLRKIDLLPTEVLRVHGDCFFKHSTLAVFPRHLYVYGDLYLVDCACLQYIEHLEVSGDIYLQEETSLLLTENTRVGDQIHTDQCSQVILVSSFEALEARITGYLYIANSNVYKLNRPSHSATSLHSRNKTQLSLVESAKNYSETVAEFKNTLTQPGSSSERTRDLNVVDENEKQLKQRKLSSNRTREPRALSRDKHLNAHLDTLFFERFGYASTKTPLQSRTPFSNIEVIQEALHQSVKKQADKQTQILICRLLENMSVCEIVDCALKLKHPLEQVLFAECVAKVSSNHTPPAKVPICI